MLEIVLTHYVIIATLIGWIVCSVLTFGIMFAFLQRFSTKNGYKFYKNYRNISLATSFFGPIVIIPLFLFTNKGRYGIKFNKGEKPNSVWYKQYKEYNKNSVRNRRNRQTYKDIWDD
jgi:hypothetical protein